jgi:hypothetical protein
MAKSGVCRLAHDVTASIETMMKMNRARRKKIMAKGEC